MPFTWSRLKPLAARVLQPSRLRAGIIGCGRLLRRLATRWCPSRPRRCPEVGHLSPPVARRLGCASVLGGGGYYDLEVPQYAIRVFGDPVLKQRAAEITDINGSLVQLAQDMLVAMYDAPGVGLAAPQVGVQKRLFVYDIGDGPAVIVNPVVSESRGDWLFEEGCLSVPGLTFEIARPKEVHLSGYDLDGNELSIDADELLARLFQHELDHLDGILLLDRLEPDQRKAAMRALRQRTLDPMGGSQPPATTASFSVHLGQTAPPDGLLFRNDLDL
jgi:peptide deformylase